MIRGPLRYCFVLFVVLLRFECEGDAVRKMKIRIAVRDDVTVFGEGDVYESKLLGLLLVLFWYFLIFARPASEKEGAND